MIQSQKNLSSLWHWESDWWQKRTGRKESCQCFSNALTPSPQPKRPLILPKFSLGECLGLGSEWLLLTLLWGFPTPIVYQLYLKSLIFELLSSSYLTSSCLDCHHLLQIFCTFTEGLDIQHFNNNANANMNATVNGCSPHRWSVQKRLYVKHVLYVRLTKTHDVATVIVFASEIVKWKLCTLGWQLCPISGFHIMSICSTRIPDSTPLPRSPFCPHAGTCIRVQLLHYPPIRSLFTCSLINVFAINTR